jgi:hypothetical protein
MINFTIDNDLSKDSYITLMFPKYTDSLDFISSDSPSCAGLLNLQPILNCSFSFKTNVLTITNILNEDKSKGT